ncbi:MAG: peptidoglycan editing factor PgeF [Pseudomonadota bacterium]
MPNDWLMPDWPAVPAVRAVCTTRAGGASTGFYGSLNLGNHVGDQPQAVAANRQVLAGALDAHPVFLQQVHGVHVVELAQETADGGQADGCVTTQRGLACTIMVADCLPVLFTNAGGTVVGAAHAGWRGLAGGVLEATVARFNALAAAGKGASLAWLGPCIGPQAFEVGDEVKAAFEAQDAQAAVMFKPHGPGKWMADLQGLARQRLQRIGLSAIYGNDGGRGWCTVSNPSRFFSHRRDGVSGRFAACIWLG